MDWLVISRGGAAGVGAGIFGAAANRFRGEPDGVPKGELSGFKDGVIPDFSLTTSPGVSDVDGTGDDLSFSSGVRCSGLITPAAFPGVGIPASLGGVFTLAVPSGLLAHRNRPRISTGTTAATATAQAGTCRDHGEAGSAGRAVPADVLDRLPPASTRLFSSGKTTRDTWPVSWLAIPFSAGQRAHRGVAVLDSFAIAFWQIQSRAISSSGRSDDGTGGWDPAASCGSRTRCPHAAAAP